MIRSCCVLRLTGKTLCYRNIATRDGQPQISDQVKTTEKLDFKQLKHPSKVPAEPFESVALSKSKLTGAGIDIKTIQLLERLALVDLDSEEALSTLKSSIQFADRIAQIDTEGVEPLYTVLEAENLQLRPDCVTEGNCREDVLSNAKVTDEDYFVSPPGNIPLEQDEKSFVKDSKTNN